MAMAVNTVQKPFGGGIAKIGISWLPFFDSNIQVRIMDKQIEQPVWDYLNQLSTAIETEIKSGKVVFPSPENIFTWTWACSFDDVKVVILGQDPYPHALANGLAFSLPKGMPIPNPCSIRPIYTELKLEYPDFIAPNHGYLMGWASQGVLLLNTWLTVRAGEPGSHKAWENFTDGVILHIANNKRGVVFILWGQEAQQKCDKITQENKHLILKGDHPSPVWAYQPAAQFFSHDRKNGERIEKIPEYFKDCNDHLKLHGKDPVEWSYLPA